MNDDSVATPDDDDALSPIVDSFLTRFRRGERPALTELIARHPDLAGEIRRLIPALVKLEVLGAHNGGLGDPPEQRNDWRQSRDEGPLPERLGDYLILRRIGGGGMGVVYEAEHESLKSRVALKVVHPRFRADPKYLRRFHAEASVAAGLHHTNIVSVFDYGDHDGVCYYAMQFIQGQPLDHVLSDIRRLRDEGTQADIVIEPDAILTSPAAHSRARPTAAVEGLLTGHFARATTTARASGARDTIAVCANASSRLSKTIADETGLTGPVAGAPTSPATSSLGELSELRYFREIARLAAQVADAMEYAHRRGVLHRDIKPSNLLLDALGNVWVTDFGLAKLEEGDDLSHSHELAGTLRYMAPERLRGTSDRRGDIYSLGATLYELLTLRPPFEGSDQIRLIELIKCETPAPPRHLGRSIPRDLETIVLKALAKDPKDRFGSAGELAGELRRFIEGRPIRSRPVSVVEQIWRWCKREPWLAGANIAAALLITVLAIVSTAAAVLYRNQAGALSSQAKVLSSQADALSKHAKALSVERGRSDAASLDARWRAVDAYTAQARAGKFSRRQGQRFESLEAVSQAVKLLDGLPRGPDIASRRESLRDLAIACLALPDLRPAGRVITRPNGVIMIAFDKAMNSYALRYRDGRISVRRVADDQEIARFQSRGDRDITIYFSPDGRYLAAMHQPGRALTVWDLDRHAVALDDPGPVLWDVARFSPDSHRLVLINEHRMLVEYDLTTGRIRRRSELPGLGDLAFRPDGTEIAIINNDSTPPSCRILDGEARRVLRTFPMRIPTGDMSWSADGTTIATPGENWTIDLWDTAAGIRRANLAGHKNSGIITSFHPAGTLLASRNWSGELRLWDSVLGRPMLNLAGSNRSEFTKDGRIVITRNDQSIVYQVDAALEYRSFASIFPGSTTYNVPSVRPCSRVLAVGTDRGVVIWDLARGKELVFLPIGYTWRTMFEASGNLLTSGPTGVRRWPIQLDTVQGEFRIGPPRRLPFPEGAGAIAEDRLGRIVALAGFVRTFVHTPERTLHVGPLDDCRSVAVSPDGQWLATGAFGGLGAQVWRIIDAQKVAHIPADHGTSVAFSPDGKWLMSSASPCRLYTVGDWHEARQIGNEGRCFSPDGRLVVVDDARNVLHLVEATTGRTLARFEGPELCDVAGATFSPDGSRLVVSTNEGPAVHVWDLRVIRKHLAAMGLDWDAPAYSDDDPAGSSAIPLPPPHVDLGPLARDSQQYTERADRVVERYTAQLMQEPENADAYHQRAHALADLSRFPEAINDLTRAINLRPDDAHLWTVRGELYFELKRYQPAITDLEAAIALEPDVDSTRESLALCCFLYARELTDGHERQGNLDRPIAFSRRAVALSDVDARFVGQLGMLLYSACRYDDAIAMLERRVNAGDPQVDASDFFLAMAYHRLRKPAQARSYFDRGVRWLGENHHLGVEYIQVLAGYRALAESVLAGPAGELPENAFAPAP